MKNNCTIPLGWDLSRHYEIRELLLMAKQCLSSGHDTIALEILKRADHSPEGKLLQARIYLKSNRLLISKTERLKKSEEFLLELERCFNSPFLCLDLVDLYEQAEKPLSTYGYMLRARRLGADIPQQRLDDMWFYLKHNLNISTISETDRHGAFIAGTELSRLSQTNESMAFNFGVWLLQVAAESEEKTTYSGVAALLLSEIFADGSNQDKDLYEKYATLAKKRGYPAILRKPIK